MRTIWLDVAEAVLVIVAIIWMIWVGGPFIQHLHVVLK